MISLGRMEPILGPIKPLGLMESHGSIESLGLMEPLYVLKPVDPMYHGTTGKLSVTVIK